MPESKHNPGSNIGFFISLGLTCLVQFIPNYIGIPVGVIFLCIATWIYFSNRPNRSRRKLLRPPLLKNALLIIGALAAVAAVALVISALVTQPDDGVSPPESPEDGVVAPESPENGVLPPESPEDGEPPPESPEDWLWSHPTPQEIFDDIDALAPYLQGTARQNYEGVPVIWGVGLCSVTETTDGVRIQVHALEEGWPRPSVFFTIDINEYPQLRIMEEGQEFVVQGTIIEVTYLWIELGDCQLIFD